VYRLMGVLLFKCPKTGKSFSTGIQAEGDTVEKLPQALTHSKCPHCGSEHFWWTREASLVDVISPTEWIENQK
jgi:hypothetical protein